MIVLCGGLKLKKIVKILLAFLLLLSLSATVKSQKVFAQDWVKPKKVIVTRRMKVYQVHVKDPVYKSTLGKHKWIKKGQVVRITHSRVNYAFFILGKGFKNTGRRWWVIPRHYQCDWFVWYNKHNVKKYLR